MLRFSSCLHLLIPFLMLIASLLLSCKEDHDHQPLIDFIQPSGPISIVAGDSIFVEARISDDIQLIEVSIQLLNQNEVPVSSALVYQLNNNEFHINTLYYVNNIYLETGTYLLTIYASDGKNSERLAREIEIQALPLELKKVYAITPSGNNVRIYSLDSLNSYSLLTSVSGDYLSSSLSSRFQRINTLGRTAGGFNVLDALTGDNLNHIPGPCPLADTCFEFLQFQNEWNYISYSDGNIKAYDQNGLQKFMIQQQNYFEPGACYQNGHYFYAELYYPANSQNRLGTFFFPSGVATQECVLDLDILKIYKADTDELYLFGHSTGDAMVKIYNRQTNQTTLLRNFGSININSIFQMSDHEFYIATDTGIWRYNANQNQFSQISNTPVQSINYDSIFNEFYFCMNTTLVVVDGTTFLAVRQYNFTEVVRDVHLLYNR